MNNMLPGFLMPTAIPTVEESEAPAEKSPFELKCISLIEMMGSSTPKFVDAVNRFRDHKLNEYELLKEWQAVSGDISSLLLGGGSLPAIRTMEDSLQRPLAMAPVLIDGLLRKGHQMAINAPSKAAKSFLTINLGLSLATGTDFLVYSCVKCKVLAINFEIDPASYEERVKVVAKAKGINLMTDTNFHFWHLRGHSAPIEKLVPQLLDQIKNGFYDVVLIDPLYKMMLTERGFDENAAGSMLSLFTHLDKICMESGVSLIWVGHFSKGFQGAKDAIDRVSGSGVLARAPDAILIMSEVDISKMPQTLNIGKKPEVYRIETILREFAPAASLSVEFKYPLHEINTQYDDCEVRKRGSPRKTITFQDLENMWKNLRNKEGIVPLEAIKEGLGVGSYGTYLKLIKAANISNMNTCFLKIHHNSKTAGDYLQGSMTIIKDQDFSKIFNDTIPSDKEN
jgi:RecA-family ATPase